MTHEEKQLARIVGQIEVDPRILHFTFFINRIFQIFCSMTSDRHDCLSFLFIFFVFAFFAQIFSVRIFPRSILFTNEQLNLIFFFDRKKNVKKRKQKMCEKLPRMKKEKEKNKINLNAADL